MFRQPWLAQVLPLRIHRLDQRDLLGPQPALNLLLALDRRGRLYAATHEGKIVRMDPDGTHPTVLADTGGRPLGVEVGADGTIYISTERGSVQAWRAGVP